MDESEPATGPVTDHRKIILVGPCASGKTTLASYLQAHGHNVRVCGQEHSGIRDFWRHLSPDVLVALDVDLVTLRQRRSAEWPEHLYLVQRGRLASAFAAADIIVDSTRNDADAVADRVLAWLRANSLASSGRRMQPTDRNH